MVADMADEVVVGGMADGVDRKNWQGHWYETLNMDGQHLHVVPTFAMFLQHVDASYLKHAH